MAGKFKEIFNSINNFLIRRSMSESSLESLQQDFRKYKYQNSFLSIVSHELKTPMSIMKECLTLLRDEIKGPINEDQKVILKVAEKNYMRLDKLVEDLILMSEIKSRNIRLTFCPTDIKPLILSICNEFEDQCRQKNISISTNFSHASPPIFIPLDRNKIEKVFRNILENSFRYLETNGKINITLHETKKHVEIKFRDSGSKLIPKNMRKLIKEFEQEGRSEGLGYQGLGLGLPISKGIVELHQGTLKLKTDKQKEFEVSLSLPLAMTQEKTC